MLCQPSTDVSWFSIKTSGCIGSGHAFCLECFWMAAYPRDRYSNIPLWSWSAETVECSWRDCLLNWTSLIKSCLDVLDSCTWQPWLFCLPHASWSMEGGGSWFFQNFGCGCAITIKNPHSDMRDYRLVYRILTFSRSCFTMKTLCLQNFCHSGPCGWHIHEIKAHNRQYPTLHMPFRVLFVKQTGTQEVLFPCPPFQFTKVPCVTHEWNKNGTFYYISQRIEIILILNFQEITMNMF